MLKICSIGYESYDAKKDSDLVERLRVSVREFFARELFALEKLYQAVLDD
jgi:hypothetical protein